MGHMLIRIEIATLPSSELSIMNLRFWETDHDTGARPDDYPSHIQEKTHIFRNRIQRRKQINQAWDFGLTIFGILITIIVTVMGSIDTKVLKAPANSTQEDRVVTVLFELDAEWIRIGIVCAGAIGVGLQSIIAAFPVRRKSNEYRELEAKTDNLIVNMNRLFYQQQGATPNQQEIIKRMEPLQEELIQLRLRAANIETNPELTEVGIRFDDLISRLDTYQATLTQQNGMNSGGPPSDGSNSNSSMTPLPLNPPVLDNNPATPWPTPQADDDDAVMDDDPMRSPDIDPNQVWPHA